MLKRHDDNIPFFYKLIKGFLSAKQVSLKVKMANFPF